MSGNPFMAGDSADVLRASVVGIYNNAMLTHPEDGMGTTEYVITVAMCAANLAGDALAGGHAILWELGDVLGRILTPNMEFHNECSGTDCQHVHAAQHAYLHAVAEGNMEAAMNVAKAMCKEANRRGEDPARDLVKFFVSVLVLVAQSAHGGLQPQGGDSSLN